MTLFKIKSLLVKLQNLMTVVTKSSNCTHEKSLSQTPCGSSDYRRLAEVIAISDDYDFNDAVAMESLNHITYDNGYSYICTDAIVYVPHVDDNAIVFEGLSVDGENLYVPHLDDNEIKVKNYN